MPHGGPIGVTDYDLFQREVQFFASRGYAVLRVNFRGSSGYGKEFMESGRGQWGKKIEDDINEIVTAVKSKYPIRPGNSCIIGASYGGYSAFISVIRFPRQYKCAVSCFGVMDIPLLLSSNNAMKHKSVRNEILYVVGDPKKENVDHVAVSPVYLADKIDVPVMLMAGWRDRIADMEHSHRMHYMLKRSSPKYWFSVILPDSKSAGRTRWQRIY